MEWKSLDEADLAATLSQGEIDAFRRDGALDGSDPVPRLLHRIAGKVRMYLASNSAIRPSMGPAQTIPASLAGVACDLAAYDILKRLPVPVGEDRRAAKDAAEKLLSDIADGKLTLETDADGQSVAKTPRFVEARPERRLD